MQFSVRKISNNPPTFRAVLRTRTEGGACLSGSGAGGDPWEALARAAERMERATALSGIGTEPAVPNILRAITSASSMIPGLGPAASTVTSFLPMLRNVFRRIGMRIRARRARRRAAHAQAPQLSPVSKEQAD